MTNAISLDIAKNKNISLGLPQSTGIDLSVGSGSGGTSNYEMLNNKPRINGVELVGNKSSEDILVQALMSEVTPQDIDKIIYGG